MIRGKIVYRDEYVSNAFENGKDSLTKTYYNDILQKLIERLEASLKAHSQVLQVMLTVRFPSVIEPSDDNSCFQYFVEEYRRSLMLQRYDPHYVWARERTNETARHHYHLVIFLNGNRIRYIADLSEANKYWQRALLKFYNYSGSASGLIHQSNAGFNGINMNNGICVHRNNQALQQECISRAAYLAKTYSKEQDSPYRARGYGCSQLN